jgi:hypothetical protein
MATKTFALSDGTRIVTVKFDREKFNYDLTLSGSAWEAHPLYSAGRFTKSQSGFTQANVCADRLYRIIKNRSLTESDKYSIIYAIEFRGDEGPE